MRCHFLHINIFICCLYRYIHKQRAIIHTCTIQNFKENAYIVFSGSQKNAFATQFRLPLMFAKHITNPKEIIEFGGIERHYKFQTSNRYSKNNSVKFHWFPTAVAISQHINTFIHCLYLYIHEKRVYIWASAPTLRNWRRLLVVLEARKESRLEKQLCQQKKAAGP